MELKHPHPVGIIESMFKYILLLLFPLVRGILSLIPGWSPRIFAAWLEASWFDLLIISAILLLGFARWYYSNFWLDNEGIHVMSGIITPKEYYIPYSRVSTVSVEYPFYLYGIGAVRIKADTDAGHHRKSDFSLTVRRKDGLEILKRSLEYNRAEKSGIKRSYRPRLGYVALLSWLNSNGFAGVIFAASLISNSGKLLGREFEDIVVSRLTNLVSAVAFGAPPAAAALAYTLLGGWAVSFILNMTRYRKLDITRQGKSLFIKSGLFVYRNYSVAIKKVNLVRVHQTLTTKIFGISSVFIHCTGYGKRRGELAVLIPAAAKTEARRNLNMLLLEIQAGKKQIRPSSLTMFRFVIMPMGYILLAFSGMFALRFLPEEFYSVLVFLLRMSLFPFIWLLIVRILGFSHNGAGIENGIVTLYYQKAFTFVTVALPVDKISKVEISRSFGQRRSGNCDVTVYSYSDHKLKHKITNLNYRQVRGLFGV